MQNFLKLSVDQEDSKLPELEVFASPISASEYPLGIRCKTAVRPGQLLCFYPGTIIPWDEPLLPQSEYLISNEYDGVYFDGEGWIPSQWRMDPLLDRYSMAFWHNNRLAVGNLVNHPPKGHLPNCVQIGFRWPSWKEVPAHSPASWARLVPHVQLQHSPSSMAGMTDKAPPHEDVRWQPPWLPRWLPWLPRWFPFPDFPHLGLAFVAVQPLEPGDEIFLDYRLNAWSKAADPSGPYPDWYSPVDSSAFDRAIWRHLNHEAKVC